MSDPAGAASAPDAGSASPAAPSPAAAPGPAGAPMLTPQKQAGKEAAGRAKLQVASMILQQALPELGGINTDLGRLVIDLLAKLGKAAGKSEDEDRKVMPAELQNVMGKGPGVNPALAQAARPPMPPQMPPGAA